MKAFYYSPFFGAVRCKVLSKIDRHNYMIKITARKHPVLKLGEVFAAGRNELWLRYSQHKNGNGMLYGNIQTFFKG